MGQFLKVNGDYNIRVADGASIVLDTGASTGNVFIIGDLEVLGNTTTIESQTLSIKDNIIGLNVGETGPGVSTLGVSSGIQIDRGTLSDVSILWNELISSRNPNINTNQLGTFVFSDADNNLKAIATNSINSFGENLALIGSGLGIVTVAGTVNYQNRVLDYSKLAATLQISIVARITNTATIVTTQPHGLVVGSKIDVICTSNATFNGTFFVAAVPGANLFTYNNPGSAVAAGVPNSATGEVRPSPVIDDDVIPNMRAVDDYTRAAVALTIVNKIQEQDTKVQVKDFDISGVSEITFEVNSIQKALINSNGLFSGNISITNDNIGNTNNDNILFDSVLNIPNRASIPSTPTGYVKLYSQNIPGTGGTGLYFVNTVGINDELISKTKAFLYALIL